MKKVLFVILLLLCLILLVPTALSAVKTQISITTETPAITIVYPKTFDIPRNTDIILSFDVLNYSYSRLNNNTTSCKFFMVDDVGSNIVNGNLTYSDTLDYWYFELNTTHTKDIGYYSIFIHCNESGEYFGFVSEQITIQEGGTNFNNHNNFSFLIPVIVFLFISSLIIIGFIYSNRSWIKVILAIAFSLTLTTLLRFSAWFIEITNPNETVLIKTLNVFYSFGIRSMYFIIAGSMIFLVVLIINSIRERPNKQRKDSWENWGKDD